jgi:hypothetical protein
MNCQTKWYYMVGRYKRSNMLQGLKHCNESCVMCVSIVAHIIIVHIIIYVITVLY